NWTAAILTDLKPMASELTIGRLRWLLSTAMPLRPDFQLYLTGEKVRPKKEDKARIATWIIGKELTELPKPAPKNMEVSVDRAVEGKSLERHGLRNAKLGRVFGRVD